MGDEPSASWDDEAFTLAPLTLDEEDEFVHRRADLRVADDDLYVDLRPALLVDLSALAEQAGEAPPVDYASVRARVVASLLSDFETQSGELLASGLCAHVLHCDSETERAEREAESPGIVLTVVDYPAEVGGVSTEELWSVVTRDTPWEVLDLLKLAVERAARPLKWKADLCLELEQLAEVEGMAMGCLDEDARALSELESWRSQSLGQFHASDHDGSVPITGADAASMIKFLDELDGRVALARQARDASEAAHSEGGAAEGERSLVDVLLDMLFDCAARKPGLTRGGRAFAAHVAAAAEERPSLRRMWRSTFGRLPRASELQLKHAPPPPPPPAAKGHKPKVRMKVPGPVVF